MGPEQSALIVAVPQAEPVVGSFRAELDSGAVLGVPAHITILYPFMPPEALTTDAVQELEELFVGVAPFDVVLSSIGWFDDQVVVILPEPAGPLSDLTQHCVRRWPAWPPYGGIHEEVVPHLTIGDHGNRAALTVAAETVGAALPIQVQVSEVQLFTGRMTPGSWRWRRSFPLGATRT